MLRVKIGGALEIIVLFLFGGRESSTIRNELVELRWQNGPVVGLGVGMFVRVCVSLRRMPFAINPFQSFAFEFSLAFCVFMI